VCALEICARKNIFLCTHTIYIPLLSWAAKWLFGPIYIFWNGDGHALMVFNGPGLGFGPVCSGRFMGLDPIWFLFTFAMLIAEGEPSVWSEFTS
jgi:hypothetical protein